MSNKIYNIFTHLYVPINHRTYRPKDCFVNHFSLNLKDEGQDKKGHNNLKVCSED